MLVHCPATNPHQQANFCRRGLQAVMGVAGVDGEKTQTNHVMETWTVLGIEAARAKIIQQIDETMASHGMAIDARHTMLLADCMTYKARYGIVKTP